MATGKHKAHRPTRRELWAIETKANKERHAYLLKTSQNYRTNYRAQIWATAILAPIAFGLIAYGFTLLITGNY